MSIESDVYNAFIADTDLLALLANSESSVYNGISTSTDYKYIVFKNISTVPILTADNAEKLKSTTMQISIVTDDAEYDNIYTLIDTDMHDLGFMFYSETEINTDVARTKVIRYIKTWEA